MNHPPNPSPLLPEPFNASNAPVRLHGYMIAGETLSAGWNLLGWAQRGETCIHAISRLAARAERIMTSVHKNTLTGGSKDYSMFSVFRLTVGEIVIWDSEGDKVFGKPDVIEACPKTQRREDSNTGSAATAPPVLSTTEDNEKSSKPSRPAQSESKATTNVRKLVPPPKPPSKAP